MPRDTSTRRQFLELGGVALAAGLAGCNAPLSSPETEQSSSPTESTGETAASQAEESVYTELYREAVSSVVMVKTDQGQGTGFQYDEEHVVTNAHVVGNASSTELRYNDGTWSDGTVRGADFHSDLAVVAAESVPDPAQSLSFVEEQPVIGQEVVTIGNPYNLDGSVSSGLVSGVDRLIPSPAGYQIPDAIQTDAAVNPGNSGGPLVSLDGNVIGVVNSKRGDNIAFGISAALAQRVVPGLTESGAYEHAYLGASLENVTPTIAEANDMAEPRGLAVVQTAQGSPADGVLQSGVVEFVDGSQVPVGGDIVLAVGETAIQSVEDLASHLALRTRPEDTVEMTVLRDGAEETVEVTLVARPDQSQSPLR